MNARAKRNSFQTAKPTANTVVRKTGHDKGSAISKEVSERYSLHSF
tara:strand:+ start:425 stop:562 length:138 start_codon:yes stop_codon:yes gene_type:complete